MRNQRRHKRFPLTGCADISFGEKETRETIHALISDISLSGIGLYADEPPEENRDVSLTVTFIAGDGNIKTESLDGRIVYVRKMRDLYFLGVEFSREIGAQGPSALYEHIQYVLSLPSM